MDVSIYKQAIKALNAGNEQLIQFIDALPQMAWIANTNGKVLRFNWAWHQFTGMRPNQTEGWVNFLHPEDSSQIISAWNNSLSIGEYHVECRIRNQSDNSYRWFLEQAMPIRNTSGTLVVWLGTYTDIEDEKQDQEP